MTAHITAPELIDLLERAASEVAEREIVGLQRSTVLSSLGLDSLGMLELVGSMERALQIYVPDDQLVGITTVGDLLSLLQGAPGARVGSAVVEAHDD